MSCADSDENPFPEFFASGKQPSREGIAWGERRLAELMRPYHLTIRNYVPGSAVCDRTIHVVQVAVSEAHAKRVAVDHLKRAQPFLFKDEVFEVTSCDLADAG